MQSRRRPPYPSKLQNTVVVFSKNYLPMSRVPIKRAIVLLVQGQAEPLDLLESSWVEVRSPSLVLQVPEQIRLIAGNPERHWRVPAVNRRSVLHRDGASCQYCGSKKNLTLDHVIPRSKGGQHTWDNVVTACDRCNGKKGNALLHEVGMNLRAQPKAPVHPAVIFANQFWQLQQP